LQGILITKFNKTKLSDISCCNTATVLPYDRELRLDVRLVSLCYERFAPLLRDGLRLGVRPVSLSYACFPPSAQERLWLDVRLVSLCYECFPSSLPDGLRLDVRPVSLSYACFPPYESGFG